MTQPAMAWVPTESGLTVTFSGVDEKSYEGSGTARVQRLFRALPSIFDAVRATKKRAAAPERQTDHIMSDEAAGKTRGLFNALRRATKRPEPIMGDESAARVKSAFDRLYAASPSLMSITNTRRCKKAFADLHSAKDETTPVAAL